MWTIVLGFVTRYIPTLFDWVGSYFGKKQDHSNEMEMMKLSLEIEKSKAEIHSKEVVQTAEINQSILAMQNEMANISATITDRTSAREYESKIVSVMDATLSKGKELGVWSWILSLGWTAVLFIECLAASVQPAIAVCAFAMWITYRISNGGAFMAEDWALIDAVVGFYLAGRVQKLNAIKENNNESCN